MNESEALQICRLAKAASPAQAVDEYTPDLWALVLERVLFVDARQAIAELAAEQEWIHVSHVVARVKRMRRERLTEFGPLPNPPADLDDREQARWLRATARAIADGQHVEAPALLAGPRRVVDYGGLLADDPATRTAAIEAARAAVGGGA